MPADDPWEPSAGGGPPEPAAGPAERLRGTLRDRFRQVFTRPPVRGRRVRRTVRHVEPWSVLRLALLFHVAVFLILCVASALLWTGARVSGTLGNVESFVTSVGGFGECVPIEGGDVAPDPTTTTPDLVEDPDEGVGQLDPSRGAAPEEESTDLGSEESDVVPDDDEDCGEGRELVGEFEFEDIRIFQAFAFGGLVLVLAGTAGAVVLALLFNLMSDLTGGVQITVIEEDPRPRRRREVGSPGSGQGH